MAETSDEWTSDANEALEISLVKPSSKGGLQTLSTFSPQFTYPIFGEEERIFGYKDIKIKLRYHASDMRPNLQITYRKIYKAIGETEPLDFVEEMKKYLPTVAFEKNKEFEAQIKALPENWTPPGECIQELQGNDGVYEIRKATLADPAMLQMLKRIQIMTLLFIEGGSEIEVEKGENLDRWSVFLLYRKRPAATGGSGSTYDFAGYVTVHRFFVFIPSDPAPKAEDFELPTSDDFDLDTLPCRTRISQFVVLPPHQKKGLASQLYSAIYQHYLQHAPTHEITVEDPNEAFDDLRDLADLAFLRTKDEFNKLRIDPKISIPKNGKMPAIFDRASLEAFRLKVKMAPRQFYRVLEMHLMSHIAESIRPSLEGSKPQGGRPTKDQENEYHVWKMFVKQRIYLRNRDQLEQLEDRGERIEKLNDALGSVELEYARLLAAFESRKKNKESSSQGKRKLIDGEGGSAAEPSSKKARVENAK